MIAVARTLIYVLVLPATTLSQTQSRPEDQQDVVRVFTELVQTDVMVFDKAGHFKDDLRREDFELRIDGKVKPIEFFERVKAGSVNEEAQLAAARGATDTSGGKKPPGAVPLDRGRTVLFYVDDLHLDLGGAGATRKVINSFIDSDLGQNDEAAITSASGQVGFLQQVTGNKQVLRAALERIKPRPYHVTDMQRPPMTEYQALLVDDLDRDTTDFFVDATIRDNPGITRQMAENIVKGRATATLQQSAGITRNSLSGLDSLVRSLAKLPGRKLVFFLSNGFFVSNRNSDARGRLQKITSAAARSGVVIYSMDSRGLVASLVDASTDAAFDPGALLLRSSSGELLATQDGLNALARDTGGRAIFNTNDLKPGLRNALKETSVYYLLAWKPEQQETQSSRRFRRIEVKLIGKPDLNVRVRRGFYDIEPQPTAANSGAAKKPAEKKPEAKLWEVIGAPVPDRSIPFSLSLLYTNTVEKGGLLSTAMQIPSDFLVFTPIDGKQQSVIEVGGAVYNEHGQIGARFNERITLAAPKPGAVGRNRDFIYTFPVSLPAGLYQARVGVRDVTSGKAGSVHQWIQIPKLVPGELALSSLHLGERDPTLVTNASVTTPNSAEDVALSIDHRFHSSSYLRFLVFVYNAARAATDSKPDVALQVQLIRDNQPVVTTALKKAHTEGVEDLNRLPYAAELSLSGLSAGRYLLKVTAVDRVAKRSSYQETPIEIE